MAGVASMSRVSATPQVSVVMSAFNDAQHVGRALDSVLTGQDVDLELIVVDDGSTDATPTLLADRAARGNRLRVIRQENRGLTMALIAGCAAARGDYIARQDADDVSLPGRLPAQTLLLDSNPELSFVSSWAEVMGPADEPLLLHKRPAGPDAATSLLVDDRCGPPGHGSVMMRRSAYQRVGGYRPKFYYAQDSDLWLRLATVGKLDYVQRALYRYRIATESISGRLHAHKLPYAKLIDEIHAARQRGEDPEAVYQRATLPPRSNERAKSSAANTAYFIGRCLLARRDPRARRYFRDALSAEWWRPKHWIAATVCELLAPFWPAEGWPLA
jgi:glycosyltransferase involved in cell wall biosynthesis